MLCNTGEGHWHRRREGVIRAGRLLLNWLTVGIKQWVGSCVATIGQSGESLCERNSGVRLGPAGML